MIALKFNLFSLPLSLFLYYVLFQTYQWVHLRDYLTIQSCNCLIIYKSQQLGTDDQVITKIVAGEYSDRAGSRPFPALGKN